MKKLFSILLALALVGGILGGCAPKAEDGGDAGAAADSGAGAEAGDEGH